MTHERALAPTYRAGSCLKLACATCTLGGRVVLIDHRTEEIGLTGDVRVCSVRDAALSRAAATMRGRTHQAAA